VIALKFLATGAVAPYTGFRWSPGEWVTAPADRADAWIHACRAADLPYWLDEELWRVELDAPVHEARYQIASPRGRLLERVEAWDGSVARAFTNACAWRARDVALPQLAPALRDGVARAASLDAIREIDVARGSLAGAYLADVVKWALQGRPAMTSYVGAVLASSSGGGLAAFEAERAWQARWLAEGLRIE
jgi:hypothetical protein